MTYKEILAEYEVYPSDIMYECVGKGLEDMEEIRDESYRKYNLMGTELSWEFEKREHTRGWSRRKKCKINNRLLRYFRNLRRRLA